MAVFRVERNKGYTVMSNHHLRNKELSLKAKGLLSQMLSLPEDWDYTLAGLSYINRESIDAIRTAVWELEKAGYMLPYKTLSFSKIEGRHGTFAFLDKCEDRSRNIRKARPSVRAQLTADKKTAAPKKAAAKRKNHDLEV